MVFRVGGGVDDRGRDLPARLEETTCPGRTLAEDDGDALDTVNWWLGAVTWDGFSGRPAGPPQWPFPGGIERQPGKLADAHEVLLGEWPHVVGQKPTPARGPSPAEPEEPPVSSGKARRMARKGRR